MPAIGQYGEGTVYHQMGSERYLNRADWKNGSGVISFSTGLTPPPHLRYWGHAQAHA